MNRFVRNTAFSSLAGLCAAIGGLVCAVLAARVLGVAGAGTVVFTLWLATVLAAFCDLGIAGCLTRFLPELTSRNSEALAESVVGYLFRPALLAALGLPAAVGLIVLLADAFAPARFAANPLAAEHWALLLALCVTQALSGFFFSVLRGWQRFDQVARVVVIAMACQIVLVLLGAMGGGAAGALGGYLAGALVSTVMLARLPPKGPPLPDDLQRRLRRYALYTWVANLTSLLVWSRVEVLFLQHYFGAESVGLFSVGLTLSSLAVQGPLLFTGGILSFFSERTGTESREAVEAVLNLGTRLVAFVILPLSFGLGALTPEVVPMIYGRGFEAAIPSAVLLVAVTGLGAVGTVATSLLHAQERSDVIFYCSLVGGVLSVLGSLLVIPVFGLMGAVVCRALVQMTMLGLGFGFVVRWLGFAMPLGHLARLVLAAAACAASAYACTVVAPGPSGLPLAVAVGGLVYLAAVRQLGGLPPEDLRRIGAACDKAPVAVRRPVHLVLHLLDRT